MPMQVCHGVPRKYAQLFVQSMLLTVSCTPVPGHRSPYSQPQKARPASARCQLLFAVSFHTSKAALRVRVTEGLSDHNYLSYDLQQKCPTLRTCRLTDTSNCEFAGRSMHAMYLWRCSGRVSGLSSPAAKAETARATIHGPMVPEHLKSFIPDG